MLVDCRRCAPRHAWLRVLYTPRPTARAAVGSGLGETDLAMLDLLAGFDLPRTVVLTKTDKLKPRKLHAVTLEITATLLSLGHGPRREWGEFFPFTLPRVVGCVHVLFTSSFTLRSRHERNSWTSCYSKV